MTKDIVETFEMVQIQENNCERAILAASPLQFAVERFLHEAAIEESCKRITYGLVAQSLPQPKACQRQSHLAGNRSGKPLLRILQRFECFHSFIAGAAIILDVKDSYGVSLRHHGHTKIIRWN